MALFANLTVRFNAGVFLSGATAVASLISQRMAGPVFFEATVVTGATEVVAAALAGSIGDAISGTFPVPLTQTHLPAVEVLIFWLSSDAEYPEDFAKDGPLKTALLSTNCSKRTSSPAAKATLPRFFALNE